MTSGTQIVVAAISHTATPVAAPKGQMTGKADAITATAVATAPIQTVAPHSLVGRTTLGEPERDLSKEAGGLANAALNACLNGKDTANMRDIAGMAGQPKSPGHLSPGGTPFCVFRTVMRNAGSAMLYPHAETVAKAALGREATDGTVATLAGAGATVVNELGTAPLVWASDKAKLAKSGEDVSWGDLGDTLKGKSPIEAAKEVNKRTSSKLAQNTIQGAAFWGGYTVIAQQMTETAKQIRDHGKAAADPSRKKDVDPATSILISTTAGIGAGALSGAIGNPFYALGIQQRKGLGLQDAAKAVMKNPVKGMGFAAGRGALASAVFGAVAGTAQQVQKVWTSTHHSSPPRPAPQESVVSDGAEDFMLSSAE